MKIKGVIITCIVVVLYLSLCSWRFERLDEVDETGDNVLVVSVK